MWQSIYAKNNFTLCDPALIWGLRNDGVVDFRDLSNVDYSAVIARMRAFGLKFGFVVATGENGARSVGCFARTDRAFTDEEKQTGLRFLLEIHSLAARQCDTLTPAQIEALMLVAGGARHASAAHTLGITESALKARLKSARHNLGARTTTEAVQLVHALGCV
jgi:LuxR family transcriptional regulator